MLYIYLIYFCLILFGDYEKLNRKNVITILLSIYLLWYLLVPLLSFIAGNKVAILGTVSGIKSLLYSLLYNYLRFALLVMPFIVLALNKMTNEKKPKSLVNIFNFSIKKLAIIAIILVVIGFSVILVLSRF